LGFNINDERLQVLQTKILRYPKDC
jgi:hypothetical protein